jgi:glycosyltransferase involved in cell wall biosynthesis
MDLTCVSLAIRWFVGWYVGARLPTLESLQSAPRAAHAGDPHAAITVIVPARNEAASLPALLESLALQSYPPLEVIVVDDESADETAAVAANAGVKILKSRPRPAGWLGKPWACAQGAAAAAGDVLVFLDADTVANRDLLRLLAGAISATRSLVSVAPYHRTERPYESLSALFNLVALMAVGSLSLRTTTPITGAFGPCLAMRTQDYAALGGHHAVRGEVLEDVALARVSHQHALPIVNVVGASHLRYRMYPAGVMQAVEGWSKNFAAGATRTPIFRLLAIVAWMSGLIEAGGGAAIEVAQMVSAGAASSWHYSFFYLLGVFQLWFLLRRLGNFAAVAFVHPLASLVFLAICARSMILLIRGEVTWKGRTIAVRGGAHD